MDLAPAPTISPFARLGARIRAALLLLQLYLTMKGAPELVYHFAIIPAYYLKVAVLTITAWVTGKTFILRRPNHLPRFIARPHSKDVRIFSLAPEDKIRILSRVHVQTCVFPRIRLWRTPNTVLNLVGHSERFHPPLRLPLDLTPYRLVGPYLTQGLGLIGRDFCVALVEELGRIPNEDGMIIGQFYSWTEDRIVHGRIPIRFVVPAGVEEIAEVKGGMVCFRWPETHGIIHGLQAEVFSPSDIEFAFDAMDAAADDVSAIGV